MSSFSQLFLINLIYFVLQGTVVFDEAFSKDMSCHTKNMIKSACRICKKISRNRELVKPGGSNCFTKDVRLVLAKKFPNDCQDLPTANSKKIKSFLVVKRDPERGSQVEWFAMAFSSVSVNFLLQQLITCEQISLLLIFFKITEWNPCYKDDKLTDRLCKNWYELRHVFFRQQKSVPATAHSMKITRNGRNNYKKFCLKKMSQTR